MPSDPAPHERVFYRRGTDGQRGYLVQRGKKDMIRLDRPMEEILFPLTGEWTADQQIHPLTAAAVAAVSFAADRALCKAMGRQVKSKEADWLSYPEESRIKWMEDGPDTGDVRDDLYDAITGTLRSLTE